MIRAVDFFAGAGGWTAGAMQAGVKVVAAANHWQLAVDSHRANHPGAVHICQDLNLFDPGKLPAFDALIASPSCQGHSNARGTDKPRHDASRATAWCVVDAAEVRRPSTILVENVVEFRAWTLYPAWRSALEALGYQLSENVLDASHFGVPQERTRLFVVAKLGRRAPKVVAPMLRAPSAGDIIDWKGGSWSLVADKAESTQQRVADGYRRGWKQFLICFYGSGSGMLARSLDRPLGTVTTLARWAVVDGKRLRMLSVPELKRAMGFPADYVLRGTQRDQIMQLGNAVCPPVAAEIARQTLLVN